MDKLHTQRPVFPFSYEEAPLRTGVCETIVGPLFGEQLRGAVPASVAVQPTGKNSRAGDQIHEVNEELGESLLFVAASPVMRKLHAQIESLAKVDIPILIVGETG